MKHLFFLFQYIINPKTVGAIAPSSKFLAEKMIENINFMNAKYIVEYGPGTGVFTEKLIQRKKAETVLLLVENNMEFFSLLKEKYKEKENVIIIHGSAENIDEYAAAYDFPYIDYVVSGLPFASLPKQVSTTILEKTAKILKNEGQFITFQYTKLKTTFIHQFFNEIVIKKEYRNIPPAYILSCTNSIECTEEYENAANINCG